MHAAAQMHVQLGQVEVSRSMKIGSHCSDLITYRSGGAHDQPDSQGCNRVVLHAATQLLPAPKYLLQLDRKIKWVSFWERQTLGTGLLAASQEDFRFQVSSGKSALNWVSCADQDAKQQLEQVIAVEPANGHAWHTLGLLEEQQGNQQEALDCFTRGQQSDGVPFALLCMLPELLANLN